MGKNKAERQAAMAANTENTENDAGAQTDPNPAEGGEQTNTEAQTDPNPAPAVAATAEVKAKSIVPAKYAGKYKDGGSSPTSQFIKDQCVGKDGFEFSAFFQLCRVNGIAEEQVKRYEGDIAAKKHGAQGRARMTLRNMLATIARKNGKLKKQDGTEQDVVEAKQAVSGAAAKAQETASKDTPSEQEQQSAN